MLILTRYPNEVIVIGADVRVTVLGVKGNRVRIGIAAPRDVPVDRLEIHERKAAEKLAAAPVGHPVLDRSLET